MMPRYADNKREAPKRHWPPQGKIKMQVVNQYAARSFIIRKGNGSIAYHQTAMVTNLVTERPENLVMHSR
jgi:hypothetical protein